MKACRTPSCLERRFRWPGKAPRHQDFPGLLPTPSFPPAFPIRSLRLPLLCQRNGPWSGHDVTGCGPSDRRVKRYDFHSEGKSAGSRAHRNFPALFPDVPLPYPLTIATDGPVSVFAGMESGGRCNAARGVSLTKLLCLQAPPLKAVVFPLGISTKSSISERLS